MAKISIIVPIYKVEQYLERCIDSILGQTFRDFELILVDDESPDGCPGICDAYAEKDDRVIVIHKKNGGVSAARNAGLDTAKGEYIYFVDSDDWIADNTLETVLPYLGKYDMVRFSCSCVTDDTAEQIICSATGGFSMDDDNKRISFIVQKLLTLSFPWSACTGIFKREMIEVYHIRFPEGQNYAEDMFFSLLYSLHAKNVFVIDKCLYYYYQRKGSMMEIQKFILNTDKINVLSKGILEYYKANNMGSLYFETFPAVHYQIFRIELWRNRNALRCGISEKRSRLLDDIDDFEYFAKWMLKLRNCREYLAPLYPRKAELEREISCMEYYATGKKSILIKVKFLSVYLKCRIKAGQIWRFLIKPVDSFI